MAKKQTKKTKTKTDTISNIILGAAIVIFLAAAVLLVVHLVSNNQSTSSGSSVSAEEISYEQVDMTDMAKTLVKKESKAQKKYDDAYVELTGIVAETDANSNNYLILSCGSEEEDLAEVQFVCYFSPAEESLTEATYEVGDTVTVLGQVIYVGSDYGYNLTVTEIQ